MFDQVIGSGGNAFIIIIACLVAFAAGLGYVDYTRQQDKQGDNMPK